MAPDGGRDDTCGTGNIGMTMDGILQVTHADTSLTVQYQDICRQLPAVNGSGSYSGSVVMVTATLGRLCREQPGIGNCCYDAVQTDTGTPQGDSIVGESVIVLTATPLMSGPLCDPSFTCEVRGSLEWERCPPADCSFLIC